MRALWGFVGGVLSVATATPVAAVPVFAHRYGFSCQQCHTTVPHLNDFGRAFEGMGFRLPGARGVFPVAVKVNLGYASVADPSHLPKAIVDEVELLSGGSIGRSSSYFFEQYVVDGGRPGLTRDAWLQFDFGARRDSRAHLRIGQFSLPLPVEVESLRDTLAHYAVYDQQVGANPFNFFEPRIGFDVSAENAPTGLSAHIVALRAHDPQTFMPPSGIDWMASITKVVGTAAFTTYRYQGQRNFAVSDHFWRQGLSVQFNTANASLAAVLQTGNDSSADGKGARLGSSGGFLQAVYWLNSAAGLAARYEGTNDDFAGLQRSFVFSTVLRPRRNMRFTLEDAVSRGHHTLSSALLFAY